MKIAVCLNHWAVGGAENGWRRLFQALPEYEWMECIEVPTGVNVVVYSNDHSFYQQAKAINIPRIIQRTTGPRSYKLPQPDGLEAVICSSKKAYDLSSHPRKHLIYNGVDMTYLKDLTPIKCDLLYAPARIGVGQRVDVACEYARKNQRHLTCLGGKQHLMENTYKVLIQQYPEVNWVGLVDMDTASRYIAGCRDYICPTLTHGVSNAIIEAVALGKPIINLGGVEVPKNGEINIMANKYKAILERIND